MIRHYETRFEGDYIAKLREDGDECREIVFYKGEVIHKATFAASNLGTAKRGGYLESMVASVAREHRAGAVTMRHATEYLIDDLKTLTASYDHGNDWAKSEIANVSEAINILDRLRGTTEVGR